jgi:hypothetical protein
MTSKARLTMVAAMAVAATMAAAAPAGAASGQRLKGCYPADSQTVVANEFVRVYTVPSTAPGTENSRRFVECSLERGLRRSLGGVDRGSVDATHIIDNVRIAGRMVGYARTATGGAGSGALSVVIVRDGTTGKALFSEPSTTGTPQIQTVSDLEIKSTGSAVWIVSYLTNDAQNRNYDGRQVRAVNLSQSRHPTTVDSGLAIAERGSLALSRHSNDAGGNAFYWSKGGSVFSSVLY